MLPSIVSFPLLQTVAPAHVCERDREKTNRHYHEYYV
jgi:hypothetical protein